MRRLTTGTFLTGPHLTIILLLTANALGFIWCARVAGHLFVPTDVLAAHGALVPSAVQSGQWWRLVASGFLHADVGHLLANMASLLLCGPFLERRLGASAFTLVYIASLIGAGLTSIALHAGAFVGVGASGALFGIIGALFALWILGATELSPGFFLVNLALNFAFGARTLNIDWAAHVGGFLTGMASIALLDLLARVNLYWLRCKFPEFVKFNAMLLIGVLGTFLWFRPPQVLLIYDPRLVATGLWACATLALIKALDYCLAVRHGLVGVVLALALSNGLAAYTIAGSALPPLQLACKAVSDFGAFTNSLVFALCQGQVNVRYAAALCGFALTVLLEVHQLRRGLTDVGFVGATFIGNRQRERGLIRPTLHTRV